MSIVIRLKTSAGELNRSELTSAWIARAVDPLVAAKAARG